LIGGFDMLKLKKMFSLIKKPRKIIKKLGAKGVFNFMDDKTYLKLVYWGETVSCKINCPNMIKKK